MTKKEILLQSVIKVVNDTASDSEVYLYGSQARGSATKLSDWDLLILLNIPSVSFSMETKIMDDVYDIELETGELITPLIYSKQVWNEKYAVTPLFENIQTEGIRIK